MRIWDGLFGDDDVNATGDDGSVTRVARLANALTSCTPR